MKNYQQALKELIEFIDNPNENWDPFGPVSTIRNWAEERLKETEKYTNVTDNLSQFEEGDILFSGETEDFAPAIFKFGGYKKVGRDGIVSDGDWVVHDGVGWGRVGSNEPVYNENDVSYRLATPDEIDLFNKLTGGK